MAAITNADRSPKTLFSVIVPTFSRPDQIQKCLDGLAAITFARDRFEVIVVDDGGTPPVESVVDVSRYDLQLAVVRIPNGGPANARNYGANIARGSILVFLDDDCVPRRDWLQELEKAAGQYPNSLIGGSTINGLPANAYSSASQMLLDYLQTYYAETPSTRRFFASCNIAIQKDTFLAFGGFEKSFPLAAGEDRDLSFRLIRAGIALHTADNATVDHYHPMNLRAFFRQHFNYGKGAKHFRILHKDDPEFMRKFEPLKFYTDLLAYPIRNSTRNSAGITVLFAISQVANALGFFSPR